MLGLINIRSPIYSQLCHALRKYTKYQIPVTKTCWHWTSLKQCNKTQPPPPSPPDPSHPKRTCSFNRPCSPSLNETRDSKKLFHTQSSYFDGPTNFPHLNFPTTVPANLRPPHPLPPPPLHACTIRRKSRRCMTTIVSCNAPHYQSYHHKLHLLITTNKISHCSTQPQFVKTSICK